MIACIRGVRASSGILGLTRGMHPGGAVSGLQGVAVGHGHGVTAHGHGVKGSRWRVLVMVLVLAFLI